MVKKRDDHFSLIETAEILEFDQKYVDAMVASGRLKAELDPDGDVWVSAEAIYAFRDETWEAVRDMLLTLLDALQEQHIEALNRSFRSFATANARRKDSTGGSSVSPH